MSNGRALVTGGCGFVGRRFVKRLVEDGFHVTVVDDLSTGRAPEDWPDPVQLGSDQLRDVSWEIRDVRSWIGGARPDFDLVVHLAAVVGGRMNIEGDPLSVATDLAIDASLFNWLVSGPGPRPKILYFSSSAAYPIGLQTRERSVLLSEEMIDFSDRLGVPDMTYGWSKLTGEFLARHAAASYGLDVAIYRPFSGYGEDQDFTYPFPSVIRRVGRREDPVIVWGSGEQGRDFIYIADVVAAVLASMSSLGSGEALNLATGQRVSFFDLARTACDVIGHEATVANDPDRPEGVFSRVGDPSRMLRFFEPRTSLREGIEIVHRYQVDHGLL